MRWFHDKKCWYLETEDTVTCAASVDPLTPMDVGFYCARHSLISEDSVPDRLDPRTHLNAYGRRACRLRLHLLYRACSELPSACRWSANHVDHSAPDFEHGAKQADNLTRQNERLEHEPEAKVEQYRRRICASKPGISGFRDPTSFGFEMHSFVCVVDTLIRNSKDHCYLPSVGDSMPS